MSTRRLWIVASAAIMVLPLMLSAQKPQKPPKPGGTPAIAYEATRSNAVDLMVMDASAQTQTRIVTGGHNRTPAWSPDGGWIVFARSNVAAPGIYKVRADGSGLCQIVSTTGFEPYGAPAWSPGPAADGHFKIVFGDMPAGDTQPDLFAVSADCHATDRRRLTQTPLSFERWPAWSHDGRLAAYVDGDVHVFDVVTDSSGDVELVPVANLTSTGPLAAGMVGSPAWTADGNELLVTGLADLWVISAITPGVATRLTNSHDVFEGRATWSPDQTRIAFDANGAIYAADVSQPWSLSEPTLFLSASRGSLARPSWRPVP